VVELRVSLIQTSDEDDLSASRLGHFNSVDSLHSLGGPHIWSLCYAPTRNWTTTQ